MPFQEIKPEKLSKAVVTQIEELILNGILRPAERLPSERDLAERLNVSRPSVREAIADLEENGLLLRRAGSGVFVADVLGSAFSEALISLFSRHETAVFDYIDFRSDLEGLAAERAARYGTETDLKIIAEIADKMEAAHLAGDHTLEALLDVDFHTSIMEASHNVVLLHMMRSMYELLMRGVFYNRRQIYQVESTRNPLFDQHKAINTAIQDRDPEAARVAVEAHMDYVRRSMTEWFDTSRKDRIAQKRLQKEKTRT